MFCKKGNLLKNTPNVAFFLALRAIMVAFRHTYSRAADNEKKFWHEKFFCFQVIV